jgi:hypothetical protein
MKRVRLETVELVDPASFHEAFKRLLGFPEWYGANMNAWIDCMSDLDDTKYGITQFKLGSGEMLVIEVADAESFAKRVPDVFEDFVACTASVNRRYFNRVGEPVVTLAFL